MQAWKISDVKGFMNHLLCQDDFDQFLLSEAVIHTKAAFSIDGHLLEEYYDTDELHQLKEEGVTCVPYEQLRGLCFEIIKGKHIPGFFKFVFLLPPKSVRALIEEYHVGLAAEDVTSLSMNIRFANGELYITTGSSLRIFTMDKSMETVWDLQVEKFLTGFL